MRKTPLIAAALAAVLSVITTPLPGFGGTAQAQQAAAGFTPSPSHLTPVFGSYQGRVWDHILMIKLTSVGAGQVQVDYQDRYVGNDPKWQGWADPPEIHTASYGEDGSFTITTRRTEAVVTFTRCGALQCATISSKRMQANSPIQMTPA